MHIPEAKACHYPPPPLDRAALREMAAKEAQARTLRLSHAPRAAAGAPNPRAASPAGEPRPRRPILHPVRAGLDPRRAGWSASVMPPPSSWPSSPAPIPPSPLPAARLRPPT